MINKKEKEMVVEDIARELEQADLIVITNYRGLNVSAINSLRRKLGAEQCSFRVTKNTLTKLACRKIGLEALEPMLEGPTAVAYTSADTVSPAKVFDEFVKENEALVIKGALLDGNILGPEKIKALAAIPSREVLLAQVCSAMQSPMTGFVNVLQGNIRNLVYALDAVRKQKESA